MRNRLLAAPAFVLLVLLAGSTVAQAQTQSPSPSPSPGADLPANPQDQIVLSGRVFVPRGQVAGEIVVFTGRVQVAGVVQGDVVVVDGPVTISGQVSGSVISFDGSVRLAATAQVAGDVIAREEVDAADGAQVGGEVRAHAPFTFTTPARALGRFASWLAVSVSTLLEIGVSAQDRRSTIEPELPSRLSLDAWLKREDPALESIRGYRP